MSKTDINLTRRKLASLVSLVPVAGLVGCSDDKGAASSAPAPKAEPKPMAEKPEPAPAPEQPAADATAMEADDAADAAETADAATAQESTADGGAEAAMENDGGLPKLDENDSSAVALNYKHNADDLDASQFPTLTANTRCSNCQLYQGGDSAWGACPIFPGKQVKATGWCTAYTPKAGGA